MNNVIVEVTQQMSGILDSMQLDRLQYVLAKVLVEYDITEKPHELATYDQLNDQYLMKFLAWKSTEGKSDKTIKQYKFSIDKMLHSVNKSIKDITEDDIFLYIATCKHNGASNSYLKSIRLYLSSFFNWLYSKGYIEHNPISGISAIKTEKVIKEAFSDVEMEKMRRCLNNKRDTALFEFLYATGVRVSELCSIDINDIDFNTKSVKVLGKGNKERIVFLTPTSIYYLKEYLEDRKSENSTLFLNRRNEGMKPSAVEEVLRKLGEKSGVSNVHPHRFRRTLATNLLKKGMSIEEVSKILGHSKLDTTMIYCNIDSETVKNNYSRVMTV